MVPTRASRAEISLKARALANERWSRTGAADRREAMRPAWAGMQRRFENEVDPDQILTPAERLARAEQARTAYFQKLAARSIAARRKRKAAATQDLGHNHEEAG